MISLSRWDALHLLYSVDYPPRCERDARDRLAVCRRVYEALLAVSTPVVVPVPLVGSGGQPA